LGGLNWGLTVSVKRTWAQDIINRDFAVQGQHKGGLTHLSRITSAIWQEALSDTALYIWAPRILRPQWVCGTFLGTSFLGDTKGGLLGNHRGLTLSPRAHHLGTRHKTGPLLCRGFGPQRNEHRPQLYTTGFYP